MRARRLREQQQLQLQQQIGLGAVGGDGVVAAMGASASSPRSLAGSSAAGSTAADRLRNRVLRGGATAAPLSPPYQSGLPSPHCVSALPTSAAANSSGEGAAATDGAPNAAGCGNGNNNNDDDDEEGTLSLTGAGASTSSSYIPGASASATSAGGGSAVVAAAAYAAARAAAAKRGGEEAAAADAADMGGEGLSDIVTLAEEIIDLTTPKGVWRCSKGVGAVTVVPDPLAAWLRRKQQLQQWSGRYLGRVLAAIVVGGGFPANLLPAAPVEVTYRF